MRQQSRHLPAFILLILAERPLHGGAVQSELNSRLPGLKADSGAVYRALQRLEEAGDIAATWDTSQPGPARKVYGMKDAGWEKLDLWREDIEQRLGYLHYFMATYRNVRKIGPAGGAGETPA